MLGFMLTAALVFGHMNPDTDSIIGSIAAADLYAQRGQEVTAVAQGKPTPETEFVLKRFKLEAPKIIDDVTGKDVKLVDFSDLAQGPKGLKDANLTGLVDHHKLGDVTSQKPLEAWIMPVGSTCTVLKSMYDFYGVKVPKNIAGGMLCAILSDTVIFKSPTTTDRDRKAAKDLAKIAGVKHIKKLGLQMFRVKSAIDGATPGELVTRDYKKFDMGGKKVGIGQLELVDINMINTVKADLEKEVTRMQREEGYYAVFLLLTDIMQGGSELLFASADPQIAVKAFGAKTGDATPWLEKVMSRKKQVVPPLTKLLQ